jgi:hypothetical protein
MSRKTSVNSKNSDIQGRFATWISIVISLISPKFLFFVGGRGTAKTTDIITKRFIEACYEMPGAYFAFVADTYVNAMKNVVPTVIDGLKLEGWIEGIHFVVDKPPPAHFDHPYKAPQSYKHTISVFNGCFTNLVSMDQPSGSAGNSYQHIFIDEVKYIEFTKIKKLTPALRGYPKFSHAVLYRGMTCTTDMPNVGDGEHDWILDREKDMNVEQNKDALQVGLVLNDIKKEMYHAKRMADNTQEEKASKEKEVNRVQRLIDRWTIRWNKVRKGSTFFSVVSSFVNADVLSEGFFPDSLKALGNEEFKTAICSFKTTLEKGKRFYIHLGPQHFVEGVNTDYYRKTYKIGDADIEESCLASRYLDLDKPVDLGVDFGDQLSIVSGQENGRYLDLIKNFYTLPPESSKEIAEKLTNYYKYHRNKVFNMYYDRSGNQYSQIKKDWATELAFHISEADPSWTVNLMSKGQATIYHEEEYVLMKSIFGEYNPDLPIVRMCKYGCREAKSSMELAKTKIHIDIKTGKKSIRKDKSSEGIAMHRRPMYSTNMSDAFKYFVARDKWMKLAAKRRKKRLSAPETAG